MTTGEIPLYKPFSQHLRVRKQMHTVGESLTRQSELQGCDVNYILAQYANHGQLPPHTQSREPFYGDATAPDYQSTLNAVKAAENAFRELPHTVRAQFGFSAENFVLACESKDPKVRSQLVELGLAEYPEPDNTALLKTIAENTKKPVEKKPVAQDPT